MNSGRSSLALIAGVLVGVVYFRALWWTVRKGMHALKTGGVSFIGSFIARTLFALLAFYFIGRGHPERLDDLFARIHPGAVPNRALYQGFQ